MKLKVLHELLPGIEWKRFIGDKNIKINKLVVDSRKIEEGDLFVAMKGVYVDGHEYIDQAIRKGAAGIVCMELPEKIDESTVYVELKDTAEALGILASNYWGNPSSKLKLIGVTGTNGKTTIATLLYELVGILGYKAGLLSTIENKVLDRIIPTVHTTPDLLSTNALLSQMVESGCDYAVMEVSSHAIAQKRIAGLDFDGGIFTNLTPEHLDYHNSFKEYVYTKKKFFDLLKPEAFALTNADDKNGLVMLQNCKATNRTYALKRTADYKGLILRNSLQGLQMKINQQEAFFKLIGYFNAYNLLSVFGAADLLGFQKDEILVAMSSLIPARGRFEIVYNKIEDITAIVDYAHTPDALENVLLTINDLKGTNAKTITITGAGGDRDKTKRPEMARIAVALSDTVVLTTDNPRTEEPAAIVDDMMKGVKDNESTNVLRVLDRAEAIRVATKIASKGDVILIAGKGHETYQEIHGVRYPFDDIQVLKNIWF